VKRPERRVRLSRSREQLGKVAVTLAGVGGHRDGRDAPPFPTPSRPETNARTKSRRPVSGEAFFLAPFVSQSENCLRTRSPLDDVDPQPGNAQPIKAKRPRKMEIYSAG
jgi:hypothetical protein